MRPSQPNDQSRGEKLEGAGVGCTSSASIAYSTCRPVPRRHVLAGEHASQIDQRCPLLPPSWLQKPASICADRRLCQRGCSRYLEVPQHRSQSNDQSHGENKATVSRHRSQTNDQSHGENSGVTCTRLIADLLSPMDAHPGRATPSWQPANRCCRSRHPYVPTAAYAKEATSLLRGAKTPVSKQ